ncbi:MAG TPA: hypothetical protein DCS21_12875 [Gammaproteobacteria bacterium]|nr:hypothetical protein [Gammaproteobacteria bacterium]
MKNVLRYGVLGLLAFLGFLLLLAPASMVIDPLTEQIRGLNVQTVEGDATDGVASGVSWRGVQIDQLHWDWRPLALSTGWLEFHLKTDDPDLKLAGKAAINPARYRRLREFTGNLRLAELAIAIGQPQLPVQGVVDFDLREVRLNPAGQPLAADGVVHLLNLRVMLAQSLPLGDFTVQLTPAAPEGVQGVIQDHDGPLVLEGAFSLLPDSRYRFNGQASVRDPNNQALRQAMNLLGPPGGDGRWALNFSGVLPR